MKAKVIYDSEVNSLLVYREDRKADASISIGEIIISLDKNMRVAAVEILNPDILYKIPKKSLEKISSASLQVQQRGQVAWLYVVLKIAGEERTIPVPLQLEKPISA